MDQGDGDPVAAIAGVLSGEGLDLRKNTDYKVYQEEGVLEIHPRTEFANMAIAAYATRITREVTQEGHGFHVDVAFKAGNPESFIYLP